MIYFILILFFLVQASVRTLIWYLLWERSSNSALSLTSSAPHWLLSRVSLIVVFFPWLYVLTLNVRDVHHPFFQYLLSIAPSHHSPSLPVSKGAPSASCGPSSNDCMLCFTEKEKKEKGDRPVVFHHFNTILRSECWPFRGSFCSHFLTELMLPVRWRLVLITFFSSKPWWQ